VEMGGWSLPASTCGRQKSTTSKRSCVARRERATSEGRACAKAPNYLCNSNLYSYNYTSVIYFVTHERVLSSVKLSLIHLPLLCS